MWSLSPASLAIKMSYSTIEYEVANTLPLPSTLESDGSVQVLPRATSQCGVSRQLCLFESIWRGAAPSRCGVVWIESALFDQAQESPRGRMVESHS